MKENRLAILTTQYSLLLYMLIVESWKKTHFVWLNTRIEANITNRMKLCGADCMHGNRIDAIKIKTSKQFIMRACAKVLRLFFTAYVRVFKEWLFPINSTHVYGVDHASLAKYFYKYSFTVIEDGCANYESEEKIIGHLKRINFKSQMNIVPFGFSDVIKEVYLTGRKEIIDDKIKQKAKIFNIKQCWNAKTNAEKKEILFIFGFDMDKMNNLMKSGHDIFLITQNFSDSICTDEDQIEMYRQIIEDVDMSRIVIKPHPNDKIEYEKYFPQCVILRENFPFELVYLTDVPISKIITVNSTSIYGLWPDNIIEKHEEYIHVLKEGVVNE